MNRIIPSCSGHGKIKPVLQQHFVQTNPVKHSETLFSVSSCNQFEFVFADRNEDIY